mmetsp:Transcript_17099/g.23785  ORF Transcript_17099/g.23785 Transcript_17099/m.23785 type:complete len:232 (-) Transcript_17099:40-735(-)
MEKLQNIRIPAKQHNIVSYGICALMYLFGLAITYPQTWSPITFSCMVCWLEHFVRRTFEAAYIHRYGKKTVPFFDALIEYIYYWGFALWVSTSTVSDSFQVFESGSQPTMVTLGFILFVIGEILNLVCHVMLSQLRPPDSAKRPLTYQASVNDHQIPHGFVFEMVSCPHYFFEIMSWWGFFFISWQRLSSFVFMLFGACILTAWATERHNKYLQEFKNYPRNRYIIFPGLY